MKKFILAIIIVLVSAFVCGAQTAAFHQEGTASWYGAEFDGQITASGEVFNSKGYTAAHPELPFNTLLIITNTRNNKQVAVRVNDRGPFVSGRIVDVSEAAGRTLDMLTGGTAPVRIDLAPAGTTPGPIGAASPAPSQPPAVAPVQQPAAQPPSASPAPAQPPVAAPIQPPAASPAPAQPPAPPAVVVKPPAVIHGAKVNAASNKTYRVQVGAYKVPKNAVDAFNKLKNAGLNPSYERNGDLYRVVLSGVRAADIQSVAQKLGQAGFAEVLLREER
jgi:rare lipoprotein A